MKQNIIFFAMEVLEDAPQACKTIPAEINPGWLMLLYLEKMPRTFPNTKTI